MPIKIRMIYLRRMFITVCSCCLFLACTQVGEVSTDKNNATDAANKMAVVTPEVKKDPLKKSKPQSPAKSPWPFESEEELAKHAAVESLDLQRPIVQTFIKKMVDEHGFTAEEVSNTLAQGKNKTWILKLIAKPAEKSKEWHEYRKIFLNDKRISKGKTFMQTHAKSLREAEQKFGVAPEIVTSIIGVETQYGANYGKTKVLDALVTLGFNYPPRRKLFINQLEEMFLLCREQGFDANTLIGSYAGAMGNGQFIPSSYRDFAVDGDGDGVVDLWKSWPDTIHSVANYFKEHKWQHGQQVITPAKLPAELKAIYTDTKVNLDEHSVASLKAQNISFETKLADTDPAILIVMQQEDGPEYFVGFNNFYSITRYNRSPKYALAVHQLSQEFLKSP